MCFDHDSAPPIPPLAGAAVEHEDLVLSSADGTRFAAFLAKPDEPSRAGVVILPDVRGLYRFYEELALRFAERGIVAIAFDYFGRTAGTEKRGEDFDFSPHIAETTARQIQADVAASAAKLRELGAERIFTVGFCYGGRHSWLSASAGHGLAGAIGFYGRPGEVQMGAGTPTPIEQAPKLESPILALMGGDDPGIPVEAVEEYERALEAAGADYEVVIFDGAPHSFFDRKQEDFADASADAWARTLAFIELHA